MLRLLEVTYTNGKESVALYPTDGQEPFKDETALSAEFDTKMGAAMKADAFKAELLVAFAQTGQIIAQGYHTKDETISLSPRMIWVEVKNGAESADQSKKDNMNALEADFYTKRGSAKKDPTVDAITILGVDGKSVVINDYWSRPIESVEE